MATEQQTIVIDNGTGIVKAGFAGDDAPRAVFPSVIGRPKYVNQMVGMGQKEIYVGDEAQSKKGILTLTTPLDAGMIVDWNDYRYLINHLFDNELRTSPEGKSIMCTEPVLNPKVNRHTMAEIFFEEFNCGHFYIAIQAVLALYASGRTTGLVCDSGAGVTHVVPICEGFTINRGALRSNLAGNDITKQLAKIFTEIGFNATSSSDFEAVRSIKEENCYVSMDFQKDLNSKVEPVKITLSDGEEIFPSDHLFRAPEIIFSPRTCGSDSTSIQQLITDSIANCDRELRRDLYGAIVLSGGTTCFPNFPERLNKELNALASSNMTTKIMAPNERKYSVWIGGSILGSLNSFNEEKVISREEYLLQGSSVVDSKLI